MAPAPRPPDRGQAALGLQLAHGQVLEDAVLHVAQAVVVLVEDARRLVHVEPVLGLLAPGQLEDGVQPGPDPPVLGVLLAHPLELVDLAVDRLAHGLGQVALLDLAPVVVGRVLVARAELAQLLADGLQLPPQQELALGLLHALLDVGLDPLAQGQVGQDLTGPGDDQPQPLGSTSTVSSTSTFWARDRSGEYPDMSATRPGSVTSAEPLGQPARAPAQQDVLQHGPVLAGQLGGLVGGRPFGDDARPRPTGPVRCRAPRCPGGPARCPGPPPPASRRAARRPP